MKSTDFVLKLLQLISRNFFPFFRVLGLGDLGIGGLGISIGKLDLYVAAGGFHPKRVLPVVLDVGTNNQRLIEDQRYLGLKQPRLDGEEYYEFVDEFMAAIKLRWPRALIQHEDFQTKHAVNLLKRYRSSYLMFNDDIQGESNFQSVEISRFLYLSNFT